MKKKNNKKFRLKNKNLLPQCKCAFPHFNMDLAPGAIAIPSLSTGQYKQFEKQYFINLFEKKVMNELF